MGNLIAGAQQGQQVAKSGDNTKEGETKPNIPTKAAPGKENKWKPPTNNETPEVIKERFRIVLEKNKAMTVEEIEKGFTAIAIREPPVKKNNTTAIILGTVLVFVAGGVAAYHFNKKKKEGSGVEEIDGDEDGEIQQEERISYSRHNNKQRSSSPVNSVVKESKNREVAPDDRRKDREVDRKSRPIDREETRVEKERDRHTREGERRNREDSHRSTKTGEKEEKHVRHVGDRDERKATKEVAKELENKPIITEEKKIERRVRETKDTKERKHKSDEVDV